MPIVLEICVDSVESAVAAEAGGADRIELCEALDVGGLTPSDALLREVRAAVRLALFVIVRPRAGSFTYTPQELDAMHSGLERARGLGADGVVLGALTSGGEVDVEAVRRLVEAARPMRVTFHRAFDASANLARSLEQVIATGADHLLTSGAGHTAAQATHRLADLVRSARGRIQIMAGGGVRQSNARGLVLATGVRAVHTSLGFGDGDGAATNDHAGHNHAPQFIVKAADVRAMRTMLEEIEVSSAQGMAVEATASRGD